VQVDVTKFETGAVRDVKKIPMRWDLISGLALKEIAKVCGGHEFRNWQMYSPLELIGYSIDSIYTFVSGDRTAPHISIAFRHLMYAHQIKTHTSGQLAEIEAMRSAIGGESSASNGLQFLCHSALSCLASTCEEGRFKYGEWNWLYGFPLHNPLSHALDHMWAICDAHYEEDDWGHALWNLHAAVHFLLTRPDLIGLQLDPGYTMTEEIKAELERLRAKRAVELARRNSEGHINDPEPGSQSNGSCQTPSYLPSTRRDARSKGKIRKSTTRVSGKQK
jgi:hypothetical protein